MTHLSQTASSSCLSPDLHSIYPWIFFPTLLHIHIRPESRVQSFKFANQAGESDKVSHILTPNLFRSTTTKLELFQSVSTTARKSSLPSDQQLCQLRSISPSNTYPKSRCCRSSIATLPLHTHPADATSIVWQSHRNPIFVL